jgi:hypothetical protein
MMRYIRAFFQALAMTLRGETPPPRPYARLHAWIEEGETHVKAVYTAAKEAGYDAAKRKATNLKLDGRDTTMETILNVVAFHMREEYPHLLTNLTDHSITAIYAANMNDQYNIARLSTHDTLQNAPDLQARIAALSAHLNDIPPSNEL